jgi:hypothetical protein
MRSYKSSKNNPNRILATTMAMRHRPPSVNRNTCGSTFRIRKVTTRKQEAVSRISENNRASAPTGMKTRNRLIISPGPWMQSNYIRIAGIAGRELR